MATRPQLQVSPSAGHAVSNQNPNQKQNQKLTRPLASYSVNNFTMEFHLLPSCAGCFAMNINTTTNLQQFLKLMQIDVEAGPGEISARSFYLMGRSEAQL